CLQARSSLDFNRPPLTMTISAIRAWKPGSNRNKICLCERSFSITHALIWQLLTRCSLRRGEDRLFGKDPPIIIWQSERCVWVRTGAYSKVYFPESGLPRTPKSCFIG